MNSETFDLHISQSGQGYKSIKDISWRNIPRFSILTGRNGSGKTQLLELIAYRLTNTRPLKVNEYGVHIDSLGGLLTLEGASFSPDEVSFVPSSGKFAGASSSSVMNINSARQALYQNVENLHSFGNNPSQMAMASKIQKRLQGKNWSIITNYGQSALDEDEFDALLFDVDVASNLATIFIVHRIKMVEALERGTPGFTKDGRKLGPSPWSIVNESLIAAEFPYEVVSPLEVGLLENYTLRLRELNSGNIILPADLSSGEKVILQLTLWLFSSSKGDIFPKLLLLDEPDAHLHPSMTVQFLNVINEVLVRKYGITVIMTTHSPSTVAMAPANSVFAMERGEENIKSAPDISKMISTLTAGLVTVNKATRFCFVEDNDDVDFYNSILDILMDSGPSKDPYAIKTSPTIVFIAASVGKGVQKISGGKSIVAKWIEKLDQAPLTDTFLGIVDRDSDPEESGRIKTISRYSFENFLIDPVNVFGLLLENNSAPPVHGVSISSGDEHLIRLLPQSSIQNIVDVICAPVEANNLDLVGTGLCNVTYTNGCKVTLPNWVINYRGKSLLQAFQSVWGGHQVVNPPRLIKAMKRVRMIPKDLAEIYASIQN